MKNAKIKPAWAYSVSLEKLKINTVMDEEEGEEAEEEKSNHTLGVQ